MKDPGESFSDFLRVLLVFMMICMVIVQIFRFFGELILSLIT